MGASYTRQDVTNNIATGNVINAADLDAEFDAIEDAFAVTTGHTHDGTAGEGGPVSIVGFGQELTITGNQVIPKVTNTVDLGTSSVKFKDGYIDGRMYADAVTLLSGDLQTTLDGKQPLDAALTSLSGLVSSADKIAYYTASDVVGLTNFTSFGRSVVDAANASTARSTLGLGTIATQAASSVTISGGTIAGVAISGGSVTGITDLDVADGGTGASTELQARQNLGLEIGVDVQGYDQSLKALADTTDTGFLSRINSTTTGVVGRNLTSGAGISVSNGGGGSGDPVFSLVWDYDSANQTITNGSTLTLAHGLSARPEEVFLVLRCTTNDGDYVAQDELQCPFYIDAGTPYGATATADATNIKIRTASGGHKLMDNSGASFTLTNARWRYEVRAR